MSSRSRLCAWEWEGKTSCYAFAARLFDTYTQPYPRNGCTYLSVKLFYLHLVVVRWLDHLPDESAYLSPFSADRRNDESTDSASRRFFRRSRLFSRELMINMAAPMAAWDWMCCLVDVLCPSVISMHFWYCFCHARGENVFVQCLQSLQLYRPQLMGRQPLELQLKPAAANSRLCPKTKWKSKERERNGFR